MLKLLNAFTTNNKIQKMTNAISRRKFAQTTMLAMAGATFSVQSFAAKPDGNKIKAIAFDGFAIFDARPIFKKVGELFPVKGKQVVEIWKAKQFGYQWLRALGSNYKNFLAVTQDALEFAAKVCDINLSKYDLKEIMNEYEKITAWPDVLPALQQLRNEKLKLVFLTNMTEEMIKAGIHNSNTENFFDHIISTDRRQTYKPSPLAYQMGIDTIKLRKEEVLFVAFAAWDMAGAKWFGYPTFWVNRLHSRAEKLDVEPDGAGENLIDLVDFVRQINSER